MPQIATMLAEQQPAPAAAIDRAQLARMTLGNRSLEREVLELFDRQAGILLGRMYHGEPAVIASLAHTLKGSASSVGATRVMAAAAAVEIATEPAARKAALDCLAAAIGEACAAIAALLRDF